MRIAAGLVFLILTLVETAAAKSCASMTQELTRLRTEYHNYATGESRKDAEMTFDGLVGILDKIVALKAEMRKNECKIPQRPRNFPERGRP
jgi:hypothetical protein